MRVRQIIFLSIMLLLPVGAFAQQTGGKIEVDYNNPKKYIVGGVKVEGNRHMSSEQILQVAGLREGKEVTVPSEEMSAVVNRLWHQRYYEDVTVAIDSISPTRDTAFFRIDIIERPRVSKWTFSGVKSGEQKELEERLNLRRGGELQSRLPLHLQLLLQHRIRLFL